MEQYIVIQYSVTSRGNIHRHKVLSKHQCVKRRTRIDLCMNACGVVSLRLLVVSWQPPISAMNELYSKKVHITVSVYYYYYVEC